MWGTYLLYALPGLLLALIAQAWVQGAYRKNLQIANSMRLSGLDAARRMMLYAGMQLRVEGVQGTLTDHYDPRSKALRLSAGVAQQPSVASLAIVAHELGHAEQDEQAYALLKLRTGLVPVVNFTSMVGPLLFFIGLLIGIYDLAWVGVLCFIGAVIFSLITLPVEFNASRRGMALLDQSGLLVTDEERKGVRSVLTAAALTYVAGLIQSLGTLFYYMSILGGRRRRF